MVSGSENEPELRFLASARVSFLNWERDAAYDLDKSWSNLPPQQFSMTICNQVLEHVFDPHLAFENLMHQTKPGGHIYVSIPTVNCIHGEPYFYSSGFHPRFLDRLGREYEVEVVDIGYWGSFKFMINAVSGNWLTNNRLAPGLTTSNMLPLMSDADGRINDDRFITSCWALYKKPVSSVDR